MKKGRAGPILFPILSGVVVWLTATLIWEAENWDNLKMNEVVNQLATSIEGTGNDMISVYLRLCVLPGILTDVGATILLYLLRRRPELSRWTKRGNLLLLVILAGQIFYAIHILDIIDYLRDSQTESDYIERNYVDPDTVSLEFPARKRNLVFIWLESMETTYADTAHGGAFEESRIPELTRLSDENISFTGKEGGVNGGFSLTGTTWTAGALFGQTSGLPLKIPIADSAMNSMDTFFPGVTNLGDILAEQGYRQALLIGSDADFGGRRQYFTQHGGYQIYDYPYSLKAGQLPADYRVWWGYEDEKLFRFAREHLTELAATGEPFNLSLLTVDTHFPNGYVCRLCDNEFDADQYSNVIACSSRQTVDFIYWLMKQPFYENTTVVISGDHITMDADYCDIIDPEYPRRVYTVILNPAAEEEAPERYRFYSTMDLFPTTLAALGVKIEGERLALGTNLFSDKETLLERDGMKRMDTELKQKSTFLNSLSGIDSEVYQISERFAQTHVRLTVNPEGEGACFVMDGLSSIEDSFTKIELFAELINGNTRTTLWYEPAEKQPDGSYQITLPLKALGGNNEISIHFYGTTSSGRIKIDSGYLWDVSAGTLKRES